MIDLMYIIPPPPPKYSFLKIHMMLNSSSILVCKEMGWCQKWRTKKQRVSSCSFTTMSLFSKVVRCMRTIAPLELADTTWDNVGVLVGKLKVLDCLVFLSLTRVLTLEPPFPATHSNKVFLTIDLTPQVLDEALSDPSVS